MEAKWRAHGDEADKSTHLVVFLEMNWIKAPMGLTKSTPPRSLARCCPDRLPHQT